MAECPKEGTEGRDPGWYQLLMSREQGGPSDVEGETGGVRSESCRFI